MDVYRRASTTGPRLALAAAALFAAVGLIAAATVHAAAPSAPAAPTLVSGNVQLAVSWTAPSDGGSAIIDYDVRYRPTGTTNWTEHRRQLARHYLDPTGDRNSNGGSGQGMDLGLGSSLGGVAITTVTTGGISNVYRLGSAVNGLRVRVEGANSDKPRPAYRAGHAATAPTASNMNTHGTQLWRVTLSQSGTGTYTGDAWTAGPLASGTHFWVAAEGAGESKATRITVEIEENSTATSRTVGGLTNGTAYEVQVRARNADGAGAWSASATLKAGVPLAPDAPTLDSGNAQLAVGWTAPAGNNTPAIDDYDVRYSSDSGATWTEIADTTPSTELTAAIGSLVNGTSYRVQVRAGNTHGDGPWSPSATLTAGAPSKPGTPTVTARHQQLNVSWAAPSYTGAGSINYAVQHCSATCTTETNWSAIGATVDSAARTATITGLVNGTAYQVRVRATNTSGTGPWSDTAPGTPAKHAPDPPEGVTLAPGGRLLMASWSAPANSGGSAIVDYDVRWCTGTCASDADWTEQSASVETSSYPLDRVASDGDNGRALDLGAIGMGITKPDLAPLENVYLLGTAVDWLSIRLTGTDDSQSSPEYHARYSPTAPTGTNLVTQGTQIWKVSVNAGASLTAEGRTAPLPANTYFWVTHDDNGALDDARVTLAIERLSTAPSRTIKGLTNGTEYQLQVRARNALGDGPWSPSARLKAGLPGAPSALTIASGNARLSASWTAAAPHESAITGYDVEHCSANCGTSGATWTTAGVAHTGANTTAAITGLTNGTSYTLRVRATNGVGDGAWATATAIAGVPAAPAAPSLGSGNAQLTASWTAPANHGSAITDYDVRYREKTIPVPAWTELPDTTPSTATTATIGSLTNGTEYEVQVRAGNARGDGAWGPSASDKPGRPPAPAAPTLSTPPGRQLGVSWTAPTANGLAVTDYDVQYKLTTASAWTEWAHTGTDVTATITGLRAVGYDVRVRAESSAGDGPWSASASATPSAGTPDAPAAPSLTTGNATMTVTWTAPYDGGTAITDYDVRYCRQLCHTSSHWSEIDDTTPNAATSATIGSVLNGYTYEVQVRAGNTHGDSAWSASASATAGAPVAPAAPALTASAGQLAVSWSAPANNGSAIVDYDVRYRAAGGGWTRVYDGTSTGLRNIAGTDAASSASDPIDFGDLSGYFTKEGGGFYKVTTAIDTMELTLQANKTGQGDYVGFNVQTDSSKPSSNLHTAGDQLGANARDTYAFRGWTGILNVGDYLWAAPTGLNDAPASTTYGLRFTRIHAVDLSTTATSYAVTGLTDGTAYEVQVRARNARGDSLWSASGTATPGTPPGAPGAPALAPGHRQLTVTWAAPASNGGAAINDYDVRYSSDSGSTWTEIADTTPSTTASATIGSLTDGTSYQVQVRAGNAVGDGAWSASATGQPALQTVPGLVSPRYCSKDATTYLWVNYLCYIQAGQGGAGFFDTITLQGQSATLIEPMFGNGLIAYNPNGGTATVKTSLAGVEQDTFTIEVVRFGIRNWSISNPNVGTNSSFDLTVRLNSPAHGSPAKYDHNGTDLARSWVQLTLPTGLTAADHVRTGQVQDPIQVVGQYGDSVTFTVRTGATGGNFAIGINAYRPAPDNSCPLTGDPTQGDLRCYAPPVGSGSANYFVHTASATASVTASAGPPPVQEAAQARKPFARTAEEIREFVMRTIPPDSPFARFRDDLLALFGLDVMGGIPGLPGAP